MRILNKYSQLYPTLTNRSSSCLLGLMISLLIDGGHSSRRPLFFTTTRLFDGQE
ncbi:uncharacterized protein CELE_C17G1.14 [Caenorhabditis elegans]|uniref:Uncharacterized protein n=1 Tax=Caenorhabditis elegans TaxID=6239 RepID=J7S138_CAEEL|nr:Uncharacterized protein CELE_C17G1.14 [Caenorhabditis elegans]CCM09398.1 Uncharacterized protein CELE_C17G1.14 [Caenorhabditis elegans]|eukprot:NP_001263966.1 Uncharacterized protein CELE_C17G1.14 [Caenorhabditis elegans]